MEFTPRNPAPGNASILTFAKPRKKRSKYGNVKCEVDGISFDSKKEAKRYGELQLLQKAGEISQLYMQPAFPIRINEYFICNYRADFSYIQNGVKVIEDVKSPVTRQNPVYRLKKKLVEAVYRTEIVET